MAPTSPAERAPQEGPGHDGPVDYRLAPLVTARFVGLALVLLALVMFAGTAVVAVADLPPDLLVVLLVLGVVGVFGLGWWLRSRAYVVRCGPEGYRIGLVRGAGVKQARWTEVEDAVAATPRGVLAVVLRLRDGRTTTIPVGLLSIDKDDFVRELQGYLQRGQALRTW
ncbi:MAG: hypothetical protein LH468_04780 [Nocardioides sp.]|nr:hypothetical protein [Nocardioides sp.]